MTVLKKNLFVSAREFAQWGNLHLNQGGIDGKQIVPKEVIKIATSLQSPTYINKELPQNGLFWFIQNEPAQLSELGERVPKRVVSNIRDYWIDHFSNT